VAAVAGGTVTVETVADDAVADDAVAGEAVAFTGSAITGFTAVTAAALGGTAENFFSLVVVLLLRGIDVSILKKEHRTCRDYRALPVNNWRIIQTRARLDRQNADRLPIAAGVDRCG
jgi:hypothetical protein